jgi:hypothetical protein
MVTMILSTPKKADVMRLGPREGLIVLRSIAYVSRATRPFIPEDLDALLLGARVFNASVEVTGALFYHSGSFFQYIEGPDNSIAEVYQRIVQASSHTGIRKLLETEIKHRYFETWHMGFCEPPETAVQQLANASWEKSMPITRDEFEGFEGLSLAVYHWNKWSAEKRGSPSLFLP